MDLLFLAAIVVVLIVAAVIIIAVVISPLPRKNGLVIYVDSSSGFTNGVSQVVDGFSFVRRVRRSDVTSAIQQAKREGLSIVVVGGEDTTDTLSLYSTVQAAAPGTFVVSPGMTAYVSPSKYPYLVRVLPSTQNEVTAAVLTLVGRLEKASVRPAVVRGRVPDPGFEGIYQREFISQMQAQNSEWEVPIISLDGWLAGERPEEYDSLVVIVNGSEMDELYPTLPEAIPIVGTSLLTTYQPQVDITSEVHVFVVSPTINNYTTTTRTVYESIIKRGGSDEVFPISAAAYNTWDFLSHLQTIFESRKTVGWSTLEDRTDAAIPPAGTLGSWYNEAAGGQVVGVYNVTSLYTSLTPEQQRTERVASRGYPGIVASGNDIYQIGRQFSNGHIIETFTLNTLDLYAYPDLEPVVIKPSYQQRLGVMGAGDIAPSFYTIPIQKIGTSYHLIPFEGDQPTMLAYPIATTTNTITPFDCVGQAQNAFNQVTDQNACTVVSSAALSSYIAGAGNSKPSGQCPSGSLNPWYIWFSDNSLNPVDQPNIDISGIVNADQVNWVSFLPLIPSQTEPPAIFSYLWEGSCWIGYTSYIYDVNTNTVFFPQQYDVTTNDNSFLCDSC